MQASPDRQSFTLLRQARKGLGQGLRAIEADNIAESDEISLPHHLLAVCLPSTGFVPGWAMGRCTVEAHRLAWLRWTRLARRWPLRTLARIRSSAINVPSGVPGANQRHRDDHASAAVTFVAVCACAASRQRVCQAVKAGQGSRIAAPPHGLLHVEDRCDRRN